MDEGKELIKKAKTLFEKKQYNEIIALLQDKLLHKNNNDELYAWRSWAHYRLNEGDKAFVYANKAISANPKSFFGYRQRGAVWSLREDYDKAITDYNKAIELKNDYSEAYYSRGNAWYDKGDNHKAIADYNKAIELKNDYVEAYYNRGISWINKGDNVKAITDFDKAIELKKNHSNAYINRGVSWNNIGNHDKAIADYNKAIEIKPDDALAFSNRGQAFYSIGDFQKAVADFERAKKLDFINYRSLDYDIRLAKEKITEAENLEASKALPTDKEERIKIEKEIEKTINTIRKAARSEVKTIVHYTKVFVADIYVKNIGGKMQYSNAIYMNDPMEGQMLFEYLNEKEIEEAYRFGEKRTETSVYLGSFLPVEENDGDVSHEDELVMWRTYGKDENGKEAAGCSVVLSSDFFKTKIANKESIREKEISREELLNVVYIKIQKDKREITDDPKGKIKAAMDNLKKLLQALIKLRKKYEHDKKGDFYKDIESIIFKQLSAISYLFKSADYQFEREVRVITYMPRDSDLVKSRENKETNAPCKRFYIESENDILPYIKKIFLGPKVENYQQWSLYFDYEIRQRAKELEAMLSPPYQIKPSDIEIMKSERKFQ